MDFTTLQHACKYKSWKLTFENNLYSFSTNGNSTNYFKRKKDKVRFVYSLYNGVRDRSSTRSKSLFRQIYKASKLYKQVLRGKICPYCHSKTRLVDASVLYGHAYEGTWRYLCSGCDAHVGTHKGTKHSLGTVAKKELRDLRSELHHCFDKIWKSAMDKGATKYKCRNNAYKWLASCLDIDIKYMHIGMLNVEECKRALKIVKSYL